jgi:multiple sugar transport system substrate-binding protein
LALSGAAAVAALGGCRLGPSGGGAAPGAGGQATGKVTWLLRNNAFEVEWANGVVLPEMARRFPHLTVEPMVVPGGAEYDAKLTSLAVAGDSPEVWTHFGGRSYVDYVKHGWLEDLTALIRRDKLDLNAFLPNTLDWFKLRGKQYALPFFQSYGSFVFYNKNLLARAGLKPPPADWNDRSWTWDAMVEYGAKLTSNPGTADATYGLLVFADGAQFLSQTLAQLWGGDIFLPEHYKEGIAPRSQLDSPAAIQGHQERQDLIFRRRVSPTPADRQALGVSGDLFQAGKVALYLHAGWAVRNYTTGVKDFEWGIAAIPPKAKAAGPQFTDAWMLGRQAKNKEGGWALIQYLVGAEGQKAWVRATGSGPAVRAAEDEWFRLMGDRMPAADLRKVTEGGLKHTTELAQHVFANWADINKVIREAVDPLWRNEATAADALRRARPLLDQVVEQTYREYRPILTGA